MPDVPGGKIRNSSTSTISVVRPRPWCLPTGFTNPFGITAPIVIGTSADTPEFAVDCLDRWISEVGWATYPRMKEILLLCDSGGSNGYRRRFWKYALYQTIARVYGLTLTVCHYPPGASKWRRLEVESGRASLVQLHQP